MIKSAIKKSRQFLKSVVNDNNNRSCYRRPCKSSLGAIAAILNELSNLAHCIAEKEEKHQDKAESLNKETLVDCGTMNKEKGRVASVNAVYFIILHLHSALFIM